MLDVAVTGSYLVPPGAVHFLDAPAAGSYFYSVMAYKGVAPAHAVANNCKLMVREL